MGFSDTQLDDFFETKDYRYLTTVTLTIKPKPATAKVVINEKETSTITVPYRTDVSYTVEAQGYVTESSTVNMVEDTTLDVVLKRDDSAVEAF